MDPVCEKLVGDRFGNLIRCIAQCGDLERIEGDGIRPDMPVPMAKIAGPGIFQPDFLLFFGQQLAVQQLQLGNPLHELFSSQIGLPHESPPV